MTSILSARGSINFPIFVTRFLLRAILASMLLVLLAAVGLGWFRGKRRWNLLAALGPALTILPLLFLRHLEYAAWRIGAFLGPDLFYERLRMGELPSLFVGSSPELLLAETAQGLGRWVFWAAAGLIVLFAALLLRRIRALHSRTGKLLALSAFLPLFLQAAIYWLRKRRAFPRMAHRAIRALVPFVYHPVAHRILSRFFGSIRGTTEKCKT